MPRYFPYLILLAFSVPLFFINIHKEQNWGDDFAQYIKQADNIAKGKPYYESTTIFNPLNPEYGPPQYPAGFPLMLAPIVKLFGGSILALNYYISFLLACLLFSLFYYFRNYTTQFTAICLALLCTYCGVVIEHKTMILSDFGAWLFIALYFAVRHRDKFSPGRVALLVLITTAAILVRTQAVFVLIAEAIYLFLYTIRNWYRERKLNLKDIFGSVSFKVGLFASLLFLLLNFVVFRAPNSTLSYYGNLTTYRHGNLWTTITNNMSGLLVMVLRCYRYYSENGFYNVLTEIANYIIFTFAILGFIKVVRRRLNVEDIFFVLQVLFLCYFSGQLNVRFLFPILPMYLLYAYMSMRGILPSLLGVKVGKLAIGLTAVYLFLGWQDFKMRSRPISNHIVYTLFPEDLQAFDYVRNNIPNNDVILFEKARCLALYTGKRTVTYAPQISPEINKQFLDSVQVKCITW